jgi:hypothetical protein
MLTLVHLELTEANRFVTRLHRHHARAQGHRFSVGVQQDGVLVGVAIVGRPVSGKHQSIWTEVTRLCTDGTKNASSFLYSAAARASRELGYERIQTYILQDEPGTSLRAAGWIFDRPSRAVGWHHGSARGARVVEDHLAYRKQLWFKQLRPATVVAQDRRTLMEILAPGDEEGPVTLNLFG